MTALINVPTEPTYQLNGHLYHVVELKGDKVIILVASEEEDSEEFLERTIHISEVEKFIN